MMAESRVHSATSMSDAGFKYTGNGDIARCDKCGLEISNWTVNMIPLMVHSEQRPHCPFIRFLTLPQSSPASPCPSSTTNGRNRSTLNQPENPSRHETETANMVNLSNILPEIDTLQQVRRRTFSHWPHRTIPSSAQMIDAGFFNCNVDDRVVCIYCNLICQQWTPHTDDPCEVHKTLSPNCIYVKSKLIRPAASSILIVNESPAEAATGTHSPTANNLNPLRSSEIVYTAACNPAYTEIPKRHASFATWPHENLPPVDDLSRSGFFYTGTKTIVTCFYCNGSLQNWGSNDNPLIEHVRWFPHCAYAKQLCGDELHRKIQECKRAQQERARANELKEKSDTGVASNTNITTNSRQLHIPDESTLSRLVAARLHSPISQSLLNQNFNLSIIKRCWEDQLRLKQADFVSDCDLLVACTILQKQIEHIDGKQENIVIPSIRMRQTREQAAKERNLVNFKEKRGKTIKREQTFIDWSHSLPSRIDMTAASWQRRGKVGDHTICPYCSVQYHNWQPNDNPWTVHRRLSPSCPFLLSSNPTHPSSVPLKSLKELFTKEKIAIDASQTTSNVILPSTSPYYELPKRRNSFFRFSNESPEKIEELARSGFYCPRTDATIQCYHCGGIFHDFRPHSSDEIIADHRRLYPHCRFAQMLPQQGETRSTSNADLCKWCLVDPKELATYPCMHLAICRPCAQLISTCPICGKQAEAFVKLYI